MLENWPSAAYALPISLETVSFDLPEASVAALDEIASSLEDVLREAVAMYLDNCEQERALIARVDRQYEAGETIIVRILHGAQRRPRSLR